MVYKKYITIGNKTYGPYYYHNFRSGSKVRTIYVENKKGINLKKQKIKRKPPRKTKQKLQKRRVKSLSPVLIAIIVVMLFAFFTLLNQPFFTGVAVADLDLKDSYMINELIDGNLNLNLQEGEFLPADSLFVLYVIETNQTFIISLEELIESSQTEQAGLSKDTADYYTTEADLSGSGEGYGFEGTRVTYPTINFLLELVSSDETKETRLMSINVATDDPLSYPLEKGDTPVLVEDSVKLFGQEKFLPGSVIDVRVDETARQRLLKVTTSYSEDESGFGKEFLGKRKGISFDMSEFGLSFSKSGGYTFDMVLSYEGKTISQTKTKIEVLGKGKEDGI